MLRKVQYDKGRVGMTKKDSFIRDKKTSQFDNKGRFRPLFSRQPATHKKSLEFMDTSGDKPPQYDNSLIVLSSTQKSYKPHKVEPLASQKASYKASQKAVSKQVQQASHAHTQKSRKPQKNNLLFKLQQGV